jgi:transposase
VCSLFLSRADYTISMFEFEFPTRTAADFGWDECQITRRSCFRRPEQGFVQLPKRWIVERTLAWLNRCRRLAKDWENLNCNALAVLKLAFIRLMLRKLEEI